MAGDRVVSAPVGRHRGKALQVTRPLHDMDRSKALVQSVDLGPYDVIELALEAIEQVALGMDFYKGAHPAAVEAHLAGRAQVQVPGRPAKEYREVARWVLESLINVGSTDRGFEAVYGVATEGGYERRRYHFKLLEEQRGSGDTLFLRSSDAAVAVLVGALEVDLETDQEAATTRLRLLIEKGNLEQARLVAANARILTSQYAESLRRELDQAHRDVRHVDWVQRVPQLIDDALAHVQARAKEQMELNRFLRSILDSAGEDPGRRDLAVAVLELGQDCLNRHTQLSTALSNAGEQFRAEQDRQSFSTAPVAAALNVSEQLLEPAAAMEVGQAGPVLETFFARLAPVRVGRLPRLVDLYEDLITPTQQSDDLGAELFEPDLDTDGEHADQQFSPAAEQVWQELMTRHAAAPVHLSQLLAEARLLQEQYPDAQRVDTLVALRVLIAADTSPAHPDGLEDPVFAGSDVLYMPAPDGPVPSSEPSARTHQETS